MDFQQDYPKKKKKQTYRESRAKKDNFLLSNGDQKFDLPQVTAHIHQKYSTKLSASYKAIFEAYDKNVKDIDRIYQEMTNLYLYAYDDFVDADENFQNNK